MTNSKDYVIFFDIDGTLTDNVNHTIPPGVQQGLMLLKENGYKLCISTGRRLNAIKSNIFKLISWDGFVCINGQAIYDSNKKLICKKGLNIESINQAIQLANASNTSIEAKTINDSFVINFIDDNISQAFDFFHMPVPRLEMNYDLNDIIALMVCRDINSNYDDFKKIPNVEVFPGMSSYADINAKNINKYTGIKIMIDHFKCSKYIAFGDSLNDFDMLVHADISIAMGNCHPELRKIANHITSRPEENGILHAVHWLLKTI